jgi:hypothetical protein
LGRGGGWGKHLKYNGVKYIFQKSGPYLVPWQLAAQIILLLKGLKFWNLNNPFFVSFIVIMSRVVEVNACLCGYLVINQTKVFDKFSIGDRSLVCG